MKRMIKVLMTLGLGLGLTAVVQAATSDNLTVTITPNASYAIDIDTANVALNMGTVGLGASTQTVRPATVTIQSSFAATDVKLQGAITSGGTAWTFDDNTTSTETDKLASWATFTSVARSSAPAKASDYFGGTAAGAASSDVFDDTDRYVGTSATDGTSNLFENGSDFDSKDMDGLPPDPNAAAKSHLWLYFRLPNLTTSGDAQNIQVTLTAVATD